MQIAESSLDSRESFSAPYQGGAGEDYFRWQNKFMKMGGFLEARKFAPYIKADDSVLDFGCGGGFILKNVSCAERAGVEINPAARRVAEENGLTCFSNTAQVQTASKDAVISNHALEHVPNPIEVLSELHRVLKEGGRLILVLPVDDWRRQKRYNARDINHHLYTWTPQLIGNCLATAGFDPRLSKIRLLSYAWFPRWYKVTPFLPSVVFDTFCRLYSVIARKRQLMVVAQR